MTDLELQVADALATWADNIAPYTGEALKFLPLFVGFFAAVFVVAYIFWGLYGQTGKRRGELSSCCISIVHGITTTVLSGIQLHRYHPFSMDLPITPAHNILLQFSMAYMLVDQFLYLLPFTPDDVLFIGHHTMTTLYMASCIYLGRGAIACFVMMFLGESTSILQNSWIIARDLRNDSKTAFRMFRILSPVYTVVFIIVRSIIGPPAFTWLIYEIMTAPALPLPHRLGWSFCGAFGVLGSQMWTYKLIKGFQRQFGKGKSGKPKFV